MRIVNRLRRLHARLRRFRAMDEDLNNRATIEVKLGLIAEGKRPGPTPEEARQWMYKLGVPAEYQKH